MRFATMILLACAAPLMALAACTGSAGQPGNASDIPAQASVALDRAEAAYDRINLFANVLLPLLPEPYATRVRTAQAIADRAFAAARAATTLAEQLAELRKAEAAAKTIAELASIPLEPAPH
jgi:hypothetical protein